MKGLVLAAQAMYLSWMIALVLLIPTGIGALVDRRFGTAPWGIILFALFGTVLATYSVTKVVLREYTRIAPLDDDSEEEDASV